MFLTDTHTHLDFPEFDDDREQVIEQALAAGVTTIVNVGTDLDSSQAAVALAEAYPQIYAAVGVHPHDAKTVTPKALAALRQLAGNQRVVALGETGLDFYRDLSPRDAQKRVFGDFIALAGELRLPLIVHSRDASEETLSVLDEHRAPEQSVIMHCFSGMLEDALRAVDMGYLVSIPTNIVNSKQKQEFAKKLPLESIVLETDAPYLSPEHGKINEPANVVLSAKKIAEIRGIDFGQVCSVTTRNAREFFKI